MATIVNNPPANTVETDSGGAGWAVAIVVILAVLLIAFFGLGHFRGGSVPSTANVNVSVPATGGGTGASGYGGGSGAAAQ